MIKILPLLALIEFSLKLMVLFYLPLPLSLSLLAVAGVKKAIPYFRPERDYYGNIKL